MLLHAYSIVYDTVASCKIIKFIYMAFQMRTKRPEAYARSALQQTKSMSDNHVIIAISTSIAAMYFLSDHIKTPVLLILLHRTWS